MHNNQDFTVVDQSKEHNDKIHETLDDKEMRRKIL